MTFNIGSQHAGVINNVAGDQHNNIRTFSDAAVVVDQLREVVEYSGLPDEVAHLAFQQIDFVATELAQPSPNKPALADHIGRLTKTLASAGALAAAGASLAGPLTNLAAWLGALGEPILHSLSL